MLVTDVVEAGDLATDAGVILQTSLHPSVHRPALYLGDLHLKSPLEAPGGDEGQAGGRVTGASVNVEMVTRVTATDDGHRGAARHYKPDTRSNSLGCDGLTCQRCTGGCQGQAGRVPSQQSPVCADTRLCSPGNKLRVGEKYVFLLLSSSGSGSGTQAQALRHSGSDSGSVTQAQLTQSLG